MNRKLKARIVEIDGTQGAFSARIGDDVATVSRVINGSQILPFWKKKIWADALSATVDELFGADGVVTPNLGEEVEDEARRQWEASSSTREEFFGNFSEFVKYIAYKLRHDLTII